MCCFYFYFCSISFLFRFCVCVCDDDFWIHELLCQPKQPNRNQICSCKEVSSDPTWLKHYQHFFHSLSVFLFCWLTLKNHVFLHQSVKPTKTTKKSNRLNVLVCVCASVCVLLAEQYSIGSGIAAISAWLSNSISNNGSIPAVIK